MGVSQYVSVQSLPGPLRLCSAQEAAALVRSGDKIAISANANTPRAFLAALFTRAEQLEQVEIMHMRLVGPFPQATSALARHIRFNPLLVPEALRAGVAAGYVDYTPAHEVREELTWAARERHLVVCRREGDTCFSKL